MCVNIIIYLNYFFSVVVIIDILILHRDVFEKEALGRSKKNKKE